MSAQAVGLAAAALAVANVVTSGDGSTLVGVVSGKKEPDAHGALIRLGMMGAGVVVLVVAAGQSSPWPTVVTVVLLALWALWAIHTFGSGAKKTAAATPGPAKTGGTLV